MSEKRLFKNKTKNPALSCQRRSQVKKQGYILATGEAVPMCSAFLSKRQQCLEIYETNVHLLIHQEKQMFNQSKTAELAL